MKKILYLFILTSFLGYSQKNVDISKSFVKWTGSQISGKSHFGTLNFKSAELKFTKDDLVGGNFIVDMMSISVDDLTGRGKKSLEGHLLSDDFFSVNDFSTSSLTLNNVKKVSSNEFNALGSLTIKGITHDVSIKFFRNLIDQSMSAILTFDRSKYDVKYGSGSFFENLGDRLILDEIELEVTLYMI